MQTSAMETTCFCRAHQINVNVCRAVIQIGAECVVKRRLWILNSWVPVKYFPGPGIAYKPVTYQDTELRASKAFPVPGVHRKSACSGTVERLTQQKETQRKQLFTSVLK